ncbi:hypothetical protein LZ554_005881 [Drepanopeziza brunnea f. sp. 'monogermtubi']|nr:hypothetical protein LZ554_005881 [Drepanopeziza brunnea f. sp. 'monogermtubi']
MDSSNIKPPHKPRKRASTPRSKTGCVTCKIRRLKCGEEKPGCYRCMKSGWHCDGYEHVVALTTSGTLKLAPLRPRSDSSTSSSPSPTLSLYIPPLSLDVCDKEQRYMRSFIDDVSVHLQAEDAFFWAGVVLQESQTNYSVRHGLAAIGALAKSSKRSTFGGYRMDTAPCPHREYALEQYEKALQGLRESINRVEPGKCVRNTVISCLVLAFFDNFIGNGGFALQHIRHARDFLLLTKVAAPAAVTAKSSEQEKLVNMFFRLDMQALCAIGIEEGRTFIQLKERISDFHLPSRFMNVEEARGTRNQIVYEGYSFFYRTVRYQALPPEQIPASIIRTRDQFIERIRQLHNFLDLLVQDIEPDVLCHPLNRPQSLKLPSSVLLVRLACTLDASKTVSDQLLPHFEFMLELSRETLEYEAAGDPGIFGMFPPLPLPRTGRHKPDSLSEIESFVPEVRTTAPLYLIATKCCSFPLRRQAIALLLSTHRREWMYDSFLAGQIGQWMMEIEEEAVDERGFVPEGKRAWRECIELDLQRRRARVTCKVGSWKGWQERERSVSW